MNNNDIKISTKITDEINLEDYARKRVCDSKRIIDVTAIKNSNSPSRHYTRVNKEFYIKNSTGELKRFNKSRTRKEDKSNLLKTFTRIKRIINYNFQGADNEIFITLTYKYFMDSPERLSKDFEQFWKKIKYKYSSLDYLRISEPQASGSWHMHILVKDFKRKYLFIPHEFIYSCWGNGEIDVVRITSVDRMSTYFFPSFKDTASEKAREKARRLKYYPKGFNIYSKSKGIYNPKQIYMTTREVYELVNDCELTYSAISDITKIDKNGEEVLINQIAKQQYKRNDSQINRISKPELSGEGKEVCEDEDL